MGGNDFSNPLSWARYLGFTFLIFFTHVSTAAIFIQTTDSFCPADSQLSVCQHGSHTKPFYPPWTWWAWPTNTRTKLVQLVLPSRTRASRSLNVCRKFFTDSVFPRHSSSRTARSRLHQAAKLSWSSSTPYLIFLLYPCDDDSAIATLAMFMAQLIA